MEKWKIANILEIASCRVKLRGIWDWWGGGQFMEYKCQFCNFGQWPSFMPKYGNFENTCISETAAHRAKISSISTQRVERVYVPRLLSQLANYYNYYCYYCEFSLLLLYYFQYITITCLCITITMAKFHAHVWQFRKSARISETMARRAKITSI